MKRQMEGCYMTIGSIVTILVDYPCGVEEDKRNYVNGETGIIIDYCGSHNDYAVKFHPQSFPWWFSENELRLATNEEIAGKLRSVMM